ncbi:MAG: redoxin domain-containing protein [Rhodovulum sp.]
MTSFDFFHLHRPGRPNVRLPRDYLRRSGWVPRIGDIFPDFAAPTTQGPLDFHAWAEGSWTVLFGQPGAFTPVCTTELAGFARAEADFTALGAKLIGLVPDEMDDVTGWIADISQVLGDEVRFPMIADADGTLARSFAMLGPGDSGATPIRKTVLIDPALRIRMILDYPARVGRSTVEMLRLLDAFRAQDSLDVATPCDWTPGGDYLVPAGMDEDEATALFGDDWIELRPYLRVVNATILDPTRRPPCALRPPAPDEAD